MCRMFSEQSYLFQPGRLGKGVWYAEEYVRLGSLTTGNRSNSREFVFISDLTLQPLGCCYDDGDAVGRRPHQAGRHRRVAEEALEQEAQPHRRCQHRRGARRFPGHQDPTRADRQDHADAEGDRKRHLLPGDVLSGPRKQAEEAKLQVNHSFSNCGHFLQFRFCRAR